MQLGSWSRGRSKLYREPILFLIQFLSILSINIRGWRGVRCLIGNSINFQKFIPVSSVPVLTFPYKWLVLRFSFFKIQLIGKVKCAQNIKFLSHHSLTDGASLIEQTNYRSMTSSHYCTSGLLVGFVLFCS